MKQANERAAHEKIEARKGNQRGWIVKQRARRILQQPSLFEDAILEQVTQAPALLHRMQNCFELRAPFERRRIGIHHHGLENVRHILQRNFLVIHAFRRAKSKVLDGQEIDFVAIGFRFIWFSELAVNECAERFFMGVDRRGWKLPDLKRLGICVNLIQPLQIALVNFPRRLGRRQFAFGVRQF